MPSILVTGASGKLGKLVVESLLTKVPADSIHVAVRDPSKLSIPGIHTHKCDYDDPNSWAPALKGIDRVLLISSADPPSRTRQHKTVVDAAKAANVKLLAYTSLLHADTSPMKLAESHKVTEEYIKESGLSYVFLRNGWYIENHTDAYQAWLQYGVIMGASDEGKIAAASRKDYAEAAAVVLAAPSGHENATYELAGNNPYTGKQLAATASEIFKKEIAWQNLSKEAYAGALAQFGLPSVIVDVIADADSLAAEGWLDGSSADMNKLIGRKSTTLEEIVAACAAK